MRVQIIKFPRVEARSLRNSQVFPSTSDVHSIQKIIVSSPTLSPVLLIIALHLMMPRWQQVTCSLVLSFLGMVGPKCRDGIKGRFQGRGQGSPAPLIFRPKWGPKGRKNLLGTPPPPWNRHWRPLLLRSYSVSIQDKGKKSDQLRILTL